MTLPKFAVVVLTCQKPKYVERKLAQIPTYEFLVSQGADVYILEGDTELTDVDVQDTITSGVKLLRVPVSESYEYIPKRLWASYQYLRTKGYHGILKIDDDIKIINKDAWKHLLPIMLGTTYTAINGVGGGEIPQKLGAIVVNTYHWTKCENPIMNYTYATYPAVNFAGGPCYWIGSQLLNVLRQADYEKCVFEDVSTGIAAMRNNIPLTTMVDLFKGTFEADNAPWPYNQFVMKCDQLYMHMISS